MEPETLLKQSRLVIPRLEKLTPDSSWAHKASGCRRSLLRLAKILETNQDLRNGEPVLEQGEILLLEGALKEGYRILEAAAKEKI